jgi:hypothetical protein
MSESIKDKVPQAPKKAKPKAHYINNKQFTALLVEYHNDPDSFEGKRAYEKIGKLFLTLANKIANGGSWRYYSDDIKEEMINDAIYTMIKNLQKYDHEKFNNPFSYFTTVTINIFRQHMNKLHIRLERNVRLDMMAENGLEYLIVDDVFGDKFARGELK